MLVDTHTHIEGEEFDADRNAVVERALSAGVEVIVNASCDLDSSKKAVALTTNYDCVYAVVGYHPNDAQGYNASSEAELVKLLRNDKVVAIGEIGLDYHYEGHDKELQKEVFLKQIALAKENELPVVIHSRDADKDTFDILKPVLLSGQKVLLHCYGGSYEMAKEYVKLGAYIGIGGVVTFKNAKKLVEVAEKIDLSHIVLETDAPYLSPTPFRGKRNEPSYVKMVAEKIAEIKGVDVEKVSQITTENAVRFYGIK